MTKERHKFQKENKVNVGRKLSEETKAKISEKMKGNEYGRLGKGKPHLTRRGIPSGVLGKHWKLSEETKIKSRGENASNWQGGISNDQYPYEWTETLKESIRERDNYVCQECGIHQDEFNRFYKKLDIHHIDYNKDNLNPENLISLCRNCHMKTNYNRGYWINYFSNNC